MAVDDGVNQAGLDYISDKAELSVNKILTEKLKLIEEAIKDFNKGELSSIAALAAISCISTSSVPDKDAVQWAKDNLMKNYKTGLYEPPCICRGFEGDCHEC